MSQYRAKKIIASFGSFSPTGNQTIISSTEPLFRESGGDLRSGDRWYNPDTQFDYLWILAEGEEAQWVQVN